MAYKLEPGRAPINAYGPLKEMGLIRPGKKKKKKEVYGQNKKYLTAKQRRNRGFIAQSGDALGTVLLANENTREKIGKGIKNVIKKYLNIGLKKFASAVRSKKYPSNKHSY